MANEQVDYDKQYQEDLERAQALSLESLALEQFKKQKYLQQLKNTSADSISKSSRSSSVSRTSSMTESDNESIRSSWRQSKPRPRPEPNTSTQGSLIAPPPAAVRRNSSASSCSTDEPDLISFTSPPKSNQSSIFELNSSLQLQETTPNIFNVNTTPPNPNLVNGPFRFGQHSSVAALRQYNPHIQQQWNVRGFQRGTLSTFSAVHPPPFMCNNLSPVPSLSNSNSSNEQIISNLLQNKAITATAANVQPPLPPKNKKPLPPLVLPKRSKSPSSISAISTPKEQSVNNLIDLSHGEDKSSVRVSILEEFDPILSSCDSFRTTSPELEECASIGESVYEEYDPYNFIYTGSGSNSLSDPIYAAVVKSENVPMSPPPLPPRINRTTLERRKSSKNILDDSNPCILDNITKINAHVLAEDNDLQAFYRMVQHVRNQFHHRDPDTNMGLVISPMVKYKYKEGTSIKLCVHPDYDGADFNKPVSFTCDVTSSVEHVTMQLTYDLEAPQKDKYTLKVWGYNEYLVPTTLLSDYEYVHNCIKLEEDVVLILIPDGKVDRSLARTAQDDHRDKEIKFEDVVPTEPRSQVSFEHVKILLETLNSEIKKLVNAAKQLDTLGNANLMPSLQPSGVNQSVKMIAKMLGTVVTLEISEAIESLEQTCRDFGVFRNDAPEGTLSKILDQKCGVVLLSIQNLIEMYSKAFRTDFQVKQTVAESKNVNEVMDSVLIRVCALHRPSPDWKHESFLVAAQIYHGTRPIGHPVLSQPTEITDCWYPRISFNDWFDMEGVSINSLARESRLVLVLYGRTLLTPDNNDNNNAPKYTQEELGWASVQFFDYDGYMVQGGLLLSIWPKETSHIYGPAPKPGTHPNQDHPVISIEIPVSSGIIFPPVPSNLTSDVIKGDFYSLDLQTQQQLLDISVQDMLYKVPAELREVLWEKRHYLHNIPQALSKVLLAAHSWEWNCLPDLHGMLHMWKPLQPIQALELLLPTFPDMEVRKYAVKWIRGLSSDELVDYLPQLVVALRHETFEDSPLALLLLERSMRSPRVAHHLFWLLSNNLPGTMPQNCSFDFPEKDPVVISEARHYRRIMLLLRALLAICGEALRKCFISQQVLVKDLNDIAENVQKSKDSQRIHVLTNGLEVVHHNLTDNPTSLPLSPTLKVCGVQVRSCSYFNSNTLPLKINFLANDGSVVPSIYKVGDDLQQDMLTLQMVRLMDKLWLNDGLDLKMVIFSCVPTGKKRGMIEMVTKAETLRKIQVEHGLTGSFKDKPIAEWLAKHNPTELEYARAVENFTASCAGYCVVTYILGICDRHNDNIMLKTSGHLFHIDFGKFLGDAQMFGNFKRDRVPFVLTSDMAYVINGGDKPSEKFHKFVDLCCQAFNIVRNNANLFLYLFMLMASAGIKGVTPEAVSNLHKALLPQLSNPEAAANFARLIESSLKSWFTQFNFFLHNLAQLKFTGDHGEGELLSFVPKTYSMATDGRLTHVAVVSYRKRYDPDKYYVYVLRLYRENSNEPMEIHRTYKEFCELHQKLCLHFPLAKLHSLSTGLHIGRSNIKQVAERRYHEISLFIQSLFQTADEIAHSDLVYTFFHPLLRDQKNLEDSSGKSEKIENMRGRLKGQLKLSIQFSRGVFTVMVHHARGLPLVGNAQEPSTYVKVYLQPDPTKTTKRKTKVVKRNCHPSFMEMLEYRMALEIVEERTLKATVWNHDPLQENEFLGGVELELDQFDLTQEMTEWFPLVNLSR